MPLPIAIGVLQNVKEDILQGRLVRTDLDARFGTLIRHVFDAGMMGILCGAVQVR